MHAANYLREAAGICKGLPADEIEKMAEAIANIDGRLYIIGLGGSLANAIHIAADFRKLCMIDADAPANIAEITARANDEGVATVFTGFLSRMSKRDALMVLSVGGGTSHVSQALCYSVDAAKEVGATVLGIVGPEGGHTARHADVVIKVPVNNWKHVTPHTEAFQMVIGHLLVSHPILQRNKTTW